MKIFLAWLKRNGFTFETHKTVGGWDCIFVPATDGKKDGSLFKHVNQYTNGTVEYCGYFSSIRIDFKG